MVFKIRNEKHLKQNNPIWSLYNKEYLFFFDTYQDLLVFIKDNKIEVEEIYDQDSHVLKFGEGEKK
ncbi:MAG: hypothetical protein LBC44_03390 [Mycoplasmataceae bacterium]|jgi:hypothetical protein|nr:hypothetical protein [Mycoplasmataceae bacterium]